MIAKALKKNEWTVEKIGELSLIFSPLLKNFSGLTHCFTTRKGGGSPAPLDSFNLGRHWDTQESKDDAMANRGVLCKTFSVEASKLLVPGQQHTSNILFFDATRLPDQPHSNLSGIDAVASSVSGQPILLHFADCVPVLLVDIKKRTVCVIHAGWRGTAAGITRKSVELMIETIGSNPRDILAAVGPAIGPCCYETGEEVLFSLNKSVGNGDSLTAYKSGKPHPDLKAFNALQLLQSGVENIDVTDFCTSCHPELFYSHRQSGGRTGRQGVLACLT